MFFQIISILLCIWAVTEVDETEVYFFNFISIFFVETRLRLYLGYRP